MVRLVLADLDARLSSRGLQILAFPCNQFGAQEPGSDSEIQEFAASKSATFPVFAKLDVNGAGADPLFVYLKEQKGELLGADIKWNFGKFLVDGGSGLVVERYAPTTSPLAIEPDILRLLE